MIQFYVDTCIWINLFKKEGIGNYPYWKIAKDFLESIEKSKDKEIIISTVVIKELQFRLDLTTYTITHNFLRDICTFITPTEEDYVYARKLEDVSMYELSFADYLHIAMCRRLDLILVTRDANLFLFAQEYIIAEKPENLLY